MMCLSCAIAKKLKLKNDSFRLGTCSECKEYRVVGEVQK